MKWLCGKVMFTILYSLCSAVTIFSVVNLSSSSDCEDPFLSLSFFFYSPFFQFICIYCLDGNSWLPFLLIHCYLNVLLGYSLQLLHCSKEIFVEISSILQLGIMSLLILAFHSIIFVMGFNDLVSYADILLTMWVTSLKMTFTGSLQASSLTLRYCSLLATAHWRLLMTYRSAKTEISIISKCEDCSI